MNTRTFVYAMPGTQSNDFIHDLVTSIGGSLKTPPHCTVIYSKTIVPYNQIVLPKMIKLPFSASIKGFDIFDTKDDGKCVVLHLSSDKLINLHRYLKDTYGLQVNYPDYKPHISIARNFSGNINKDWLKSLLTRNSIVFDRIIMDNHK